MLIKSLFLMMFSFASLQSLAAVNFQYDLEDRDICHHVLPDFIDLANRSHRSVHLSCSGTVLNGYLYIQGSEPLEKPFLGSDYHIPTRQPYLASGQQVDRLENAIQKYSKLLRLKVETDVNRDFDGWIVELN